ncbi:MAG: histidine kinase dimerization/phospho-acceptor domain-containing protein, partial [Myxococcales bacterium]
MAGDSIFQAALEALPENVMLWSADGRVLFVNHQLLETLGLLREDLEGKSEAELNAQLGRRGVSFVDGTVSVSGHDFERQKRLLPGGERLERLVDLNASEQLRKQRQQVLSVAAHDLRAPLANVRSYASLLLGGRMTDADPRVKRAAEVISRN